MTALLHSNTPVNTPCGVMLVAVTSCLTDLLHKNAPLKTVCSVMLVVMKGCMTALLHGNASVNTTCRVMLLVLTGCMTALLHDNAPVEKDRKEYTFWRQCSKKPSVTVGCPPGIHQKLHGALQCRWYLTTLLLKHESWLSQVVDQLDQKIRNVKC